jgi:hypothetical protein
MAARQIDDRQPAKPEPDWTRDIRTFIVWSAMRQRAGHRLDSLSRDWGTIAEIELATDATHTNRALPIAGEDRGRTRTAEGLGHCCTWP